MTNGYIRYSNQTSLTDSDILDIRTAAERGAVSATELAGPYGINRTTAARIIARQTWSHVPDPKKVGSYSVFPDGRIQNRTTGRFLQAARGKDGVTYVELRAGGSRKRVAVATMVASAFLGTRSKKIGFINGDSTDLHFTNLVVIK